MTPGRPREFDRDAALKRAVELFWADGYEGTQVEDLADAMRIGRGSMYAAFTDKRSLYLEALTRFVDEAEGWLRRALLDPAQSPLANLRMYIDRWPQFARDPRKRGCMISNALIELAPKDEDVSAIVTRALRGEEMILRGILSEAQERGELAREKDAAMIARALVNARLGVTLLARLGTLDASARAAADAALAMLD